jgi:XTP/dITP diphosphohydrolase
LGFYFGFVGVCCGFIMNEILLATANVKKGMELREILGDGWSVRTLGDFPLVPKVVEDGDSFEANAVGKALAFAVLSDGLVLADDSGLEVDVLRGAPGIYSARYAGAGADDASNNALLLGNLAAVEDGGRGAQFRCVLALVWRGRHVRSFEGVCRGRILRVARGGNGFGYDSLFVPDGYGRSFAELPSEIKHRLSHRGRAMRLLLGFLGGGGV